MSSDMVVTEISCCLLRHINHCSNYPMEGSYPFALLNTGAEKNIVLFTEAVVS